MSCVSHSWGYHVAAENAPKSRYPTRTKTKMRYQGQAPAIYGVKTDSPFPPTLPAVRTTLIWSHRPGRRKCALRIDCQLWKPRQREMDHARCWVMLTPDNHKQGKLWNHGLDHRKGSLLERHKIMKENPFSARDGSEPAYCIDCERPPRIRKETWNGFLDRCAESARAQTRFRDKKGVCIRFSGSRHMDVQTGITEKW
jgi:hypothetical protein